MEQRSSYVELEPPPAMRGALACIWTRRIGSADEARVRVLPDACVDLIWSTGTGAFLAGPDTGPHEVSAAPGTVFVGARFRPGAGGPALGLPLAPLRDLRLEVSSLDPRLHDRLNPELDPEEALRHLVAAVSRMVRARGPDRAVAVGAEALDRPGARVGELASELGLSDRQLRRRFDAALGYGPKTLQRVLRFQRFLARLEAQGATPDLAEAAFEAGYADQAHLTRESARLSGLTPARLLRARPEAVAPPLPAT